MLDESGKVRYRGLNVRVHSSYQLVVVQSNRSMHIGLQRAGSALSAVTCAHAWQSKYNMRISDR